MILSNPARRLLNPGIYVGIVISALLVVLAYQYRPTYDITFGSPTDGPLLRGFNAGEVSQGAESFPFRWSTGDSTITLADVGRQDFNVSLSLSGSRPEGQPPAHVRISVEGRLVDELSPPGSVQTYSFHVSREDVEDGTLTLRLESNAFSPPGDPRSLGVIVTRLVVTPGTAVDRFIEPPLDVLGYVALVSALLACALALLGWGAGGVALGSGVVGLLAAALLVGDRLWITTAHWYTSWLTALVSALVFVAVFGTLLSWLIRKEGVPWNPLERRVLLTLAALVFAVRLAGQMHPQIFIVDLMFHSHRFDTVQSGQLLFTIQSAEWGGHSTFYLPTAYIFMLPLQWLLGNQLLVIKLLTVGLSTLGAFAIFYIARRTLSDGLSGLMAASLYLTVPIAVLPFSWGITTNIFGEFFALLALAVLVTCFRELTPRRPAFWVLLFALLMALLSHPGVVQLTGVAFTFISLLWLLSRGILAGRRAALWSLGTLALACLVAYVGYYSHFAADMLNTLRELQAERAAASGGGFHLKIGGSVADKSLGLIVQYVDSRSAWLFGGLRGFWQEAQAYYRVWPVAGALLGYAWLWPSRSSLTCTRGQARRLLVLAVVGWSLTVLLFLVVGWVMNLYVRYSLFALPVVSLGAGVLLAQLWRQTRPGRWLTLMMLMFFAAEALALWQYRITYAFK